MARKTVRDEDGELQETEADEVEETVVEETVIAAPVAPDMPPDIYPKFALETPPDDGHRLQYANIDAAAKFFMKTFDENAPGADASQIESKLREAVHAARIAIRHVASPEAPPA